MNRREKAILEVRFVGQILVVAASLLAAGALRAETSAEHLARVKAEIAKENLGWTAGETSISKLTEAEVKAMLIQPGQQGNPIEALGIDTFVGSVPRSAPAWVPFPAPEDATFTWRDVDGEDWTSPVKNQGQCGSCIVFAAVSALEGSLNVAYGDPDLDYDLSEQNLLDCTGVSCQNGGFSPQGCFARGKQTGVPDESCQPYLAKDQTCNPTPCDDFANRVRKVAASGLAGGNLWGATEDDVKKALNYGPVTTSFTVYDDFELYTGGVYKKGSSAKEMGGHEVVIIGWNDANNSWYGKNEWGTGWGDQGYFEIERGQAGFGDQNIMWVQMDATGIAGAFCPSVTMVTATLHVDSDETTKRIIKLAHCVGDQPLTWKVMDDGVDWVSVSPTEGTLQPGESANVTFTFDAAGWTKDAGMATVPIYFVGPGGLSRSVDARLRTIKPPAVDTDTDTGTGADGDGDGDGDGDTDGDTDTETGNAGDGGSSSSCSAVPGGAFPQSGLITLLASVL
jgi:hypothetical protein